MLLSAPPVSLELQQELDWKQRGQELAKLGSSSYDQCIELVCKSCPEDFQAEMLTQWGIADAALQLAAFKAFKELDADDSLHSLSNSQRLALFSQDPSNCSFLMDEARSWLDDGKPASRITTNWAKSQIVAKNKILNQFASAAKRRSGYKSTSQLLAETEQQLREAETELKKTHVIIAAQAAELDQLRSQLTSAAA